MELSFGASVQKQSVVLPGEEAERGGEGTEEVAPLVLVRPC